MSTFKLGILSLFVLMFSLTSFAASAVNNPMIVNESSVAAPAHWVMITKPVSSNIRYLANVPMYIEAVAGNTAGDLVSLVLLVNGNLVASGTSAVLSSTYTPTSGGQYLLEAIATYADGSQMNTQMTFNVMGGGGLHQLLIPMQVQIP